MEKLTIEQLKFAREIGATHFDFEPSAYRKDGFIYNDGMEAWCSGLFEQSFADYKDIIKIDFTPLDEFEAAQNAATETKSTSDGSTARSKYHREIKPGVWVDVYDVLKAWGITNPAQQHLAKKALQGGERGHKTYEQDMKDIIASAKRAIELNE